MSQTKIKYTAADGFVELEEAHGLFLSRYVTVRFPRTGKAELTMTIAEAEELSVVLAAIVADLRDGE